MILGHFSWYRRWRGGKWYRMSGAFWPYYLRLPCNHLEPVIARLGDEEHCA